jgi:hypothetical protein
MTFDKLWPFNPPGFVHVTGPRGVGKTTFAIDTGADPKYMCVLDGEASAKDYNRQLGFGEYHDLIEETFTDYGMACTDTQFFLHCQSILDSLPSDKFDVLIFDNLLRFENGLVTYVNEHHADFGISKGQMSGMPALIWGPIKSYYSNLVVSWLGKVKMFIVTTPIGEVWVHGKPSGTEKAKGKDVLEWLTSLRVWLRFRENSKVPAGLVLKDRVTSMQYVEGEGIIKKSVLPRRIDPCTWKQVRHYMANPANHEKPLPTEVPTADDWAILNGTLTKDKQLQLRVIELELQAEARAESQARAVAKEDAIESARERLGEDRSDDEKPSNGNGPLFADEPGQGGSEPKNVPELIAKAFTTLGYSMSDIQRIANIESDKMLGLSSDIIPDIWKLLVETRVEET